MWEQLTGYVMTEYEKEMLREYRANVIEECVRAVEEMHRYTWPKFSHEIIAAIRKLKTV